MLHIKITQLNRDEMVSIVDKMSAKVYLLPDGCLTVKKSNANHRFVIVP